MPLLRILMQKRARLNFISDAEVLATTGSVLKVFSLNASAHPDFKIINAKIQVFGFK
jgi:hypothetical protein